MGRGEKEAIRLEALARRDALSQKEKTRLDREIMERLCALPEYREAEAVLFFASFRSEPDTFQLMKEALEEGKRVLLPRVEGGGLAVYEITGMDQLERGYMGIPEPGAGARRAKAREADMVLMPGAAFDAKGGRLGYGKGYYDRLLAGMGRKVPLVAPAYELQISGGPLPLEPHDVKIDKIVTHLRTIDCHG